MSWSLKSGGSGPGSSDLPWKIGNIYNNNNSFLKQKSHAKYNSKILNLKINKNRFMRVNEYA